MKGFLNVLGVVLFALAIIGGAALYAILDSPLMDPAIRIGVAVGAALNCLVVAAILLGMAKGLELLEKIVDHTAVPLAATQAGGMAAVRACLEKGETLCPHRRDVYRGGIRVCVDCGAKLERKG